MYRFKIDKFVLNDGSEVLPAALTVFLGPNNCGKSQALKDILTIVTTRQDRRQTLVVNDAQFSLPSSQGHLLSSYPELRREHVTGGFVLHALAPTLVRTFTHSVTRDEIGIDTERHFIESYTPALTMILTTEDRLRLVNESDSPGTHRDVGNLLQQFYRRESEMELRISEYLETVFPSHNIKLDFTGLTKLRIRIAANFDDIPADPRDARIPMASKRLLDDQGDGIRSFVGMIVAFKALDRPLILVDEPEAFLHPPQAFEMGKFLAREARVGRQIVIATHSTDVVRGITSTDAEAEIIRIDRRGSPSTFKRLMPETLKEVSLDPLLSSARVLDGLFYPAAIVTEADSDARFYHGVMLKQQLPMDVHFVNATGKQTVPRILSLYSNMGIKRAGIVDFDVFRVREEWQKVSSTLAFAANELQEVDRIRDEIAAHVEAIPIGQRLDVLKAKVSEILQSIDGATSDNAQASEQSVRQIGNKLHEAAKETRAWSEVKMRGRNALPAPLQTQFDRLFDLCAAQGLFIVPCGELEAMLEAYGVQTTSNKRAWIASALQLLRRLEVDSNILPWRFTDRIYQYLTSPSGAGRVS